MTSDTSCRLCLTTSTHSYLNIFSVTGVKMKLRDILCEHFKCDISESDPLPNVVCQTCWSTTESFHELYQKSKAIQEKFLNPLVKTEFDLTEAWPTENREINIDCDFIGESNLEVGPVKVEPDTDESESEENVATKYQENSNDESGDESNDENINSDDRNDSEFNMNDEPPTGIRAMKRWRRKQREIKFQMLFEQHKHLFDLTCDCCSKIFDSLDDCRAHYLNEHKNSKGYIRCCGMKLQFRCQVVTHLNRHLEPDKYKCTKCDRMMCSVRELQKHMQRHSEGPVRKEKDIPCDKCKKKFATKISLERHLKWHEDKKESIEESKFIAEYFDMTCDQCDAIFTSLYDARSHYKDCHNEEKGYVKCCGTKLKENWLVRDHIKSHLNPESFKCETCGKTYTSRMILVQHRRRHRLTMHKSFLCDYCGKSCRDKDAITRHIFTNHVKSEPKHECHICHKKFQLPSLLKNHQYSVHREKKKGVTCEICGKSFYVKFHLDKHMLSHTDKSERLAQRKQCEHCGEWLMTKSGIYYHEQIHTTGVQKCTQCEMELPNKLALLGHIRQYHRAHKFKCSYCEKTFSTASVLRTHEEGHTRHNVYQCKFCPRTFTVPSSRRTHTRRNHYEELKMSKNEKNLDIQ